MRMERSSGNVFADLGMPDAEEMFIKSKLVMQLNDLLEKRGMTQSQAAKVVGLSQPRLSTILRGHFRGVSEIKLMECLTKLGADVDIVVHPVGRQRRPGRLKVVFA
jgi:predicted XRE-type DNA-binding protein